LVFPTDCLAGILANRIWLQPIRDIEKPEQLQKTIDVQKTKEPVPGVRLLGHPDSKPIASIL